VHDRSADAALVDEKLVSTSDPVGTYRVMNLRRLILLVGAILLVVGVIGLLMPVSTTGPDNQSVGCGNGIAADTSGAQSLNNSNPANLPVINQIVPHTDYVAQCQSAVSSRRTWTIPVAIIGLVIAAGSFFVSGRTGEVRAP
jgi:hypothetical protein